MKEMMIAKYHPHDRFISFSDVVRLMKEGHYDDHWRGPYYKKCHPCAIQYDRIVKLETQTMDAQYIIKKKLKGRGEPSMRRNAKVSDGGKTSNSDAMLKGEGQYLGIYRNCTTDQMDFLRERLQPDLDMFGYSFDEKKLLARCGDKCC